MNSSVNVVYTGTKTLENMKQARHYNKWTLDKFEQYLEGDILEVGCGIGNFTKTLMKYGDVTAIDIDERLIENLKQNIPLGVTAGYGDIEKGNYFFKNKSFDAIVCINVLEHIKDDDKALDNMFTLLKKNGRLILLVPIHKFLFGEIDRTIHHFRRYQPSNLIGHLKQMGFAIEKSRKLNLLGALGWYIAGKILKEKHVEEKNIKLFNIVAPLALCLEDLIEPPVGTSILIIARRNE